MKKLIAACAAVMAALFFSGSAFAIFASAAAIHAPRAAVKAGGGCYRPHYRPCYNHCNGYYSLYTYVAPCYSGYGCGGCGRGGYHWRCGGIFGW